MFALPAGSFYGPKLTGNSYKIVKVVASRFSPDSVKASHILIDPAKVGGEDKAIKLADSLKGLILKGGNFAELAKNYSVDGSKDKGGGNAWVLSLVVLWCLNLRMQLLMVRSGDIKVVKSQFGYHVMKIEKQDWFV